jgi:hypothetical protein
MMNNTPDDLQALMQEASYRLTFAIGMLNKIMDRREGEPDYGGYDFAVVRDVIEDVASTLMAEAEHLPVEHDGGGDAETATRRD